MAASTDLFARRNCVRIVVVVLVAALNYVLAVALAAVTATLVLIIAAMFNFDIFPSDADSLAWFAYGIGGICAVAFVIGFLTALVRIPTARRKLEERVLNETIARIVRDDSHREVRNLLDGLAIAAGIATPRFAMISDPSPNSFGVGTRPKNAIIAITNGLVDHLSRDELEAVLAYEVTRIKSYDVALASWTVALTGGAIDSGSGLFSWLPYRIALALQVWALRDQGTERDRAAVRFTRNPQSLVHALEKLDNDQTQVASVSRATAPLWIEFPAKALSGDSSRATRVLRRSLLLDERIAALRELAHMPPAGATT